MTRYDDPFAIHLVKPDAPLPLTNPPEGLRHKDGMTRETEHRKPYVRKLQRLLGEKMNAELTLNGEFDDETLTLLHQFQGRFLLPQGTEVDAMTARFLRDGNGAGPGEFPTMNPELEDLMTVIWSQHMLSMRHASNALDQLGVDLARPVPHKQALAKELLEFGARMAVTMLPSVAGLAVEKILGLHPPKDEGEKDVVKAAIEAPFDVLKDDAEKKIEAAFHHWQEPRAPEVAAPDFVEAQRRKMTHDTAAAEETFLITSKAEMRWQDPYATAAVPGQDPRVATARKALDAAKEVSSRAETAQYTRSFSEWSNALARTDLRDLDQKDASKGVDMADQNKVEHARGVLDLKGRADFDDPSKAVHMYQTFTMSGVSKDAAAHLKGTRLGELSMPKHAEITVYGAGEPFTIVLGSSGSTVWNGVHTSRDRERARRYLATKVSAPGMAVTDALVAAGARHILEAEMKDVVIDFVKIEG